VTDTLGNMLEGVMHGADAQDRDGAPGLIERSRDDHHRPGHFTKEPILLVSLMCGTEVLSTSTAVFGDEWLSEVSLNSLFSNRP
jgi:hypothetical protein